MRPAFTHKAGLHASALRVDPGLYQHIDPGRVGNAMRVLVSDMGGRSSVELKARELGYDVSAGSEAVGRAAARVKELESRGYSFESADASFELLLREELAGAGPTAAVRASRAGRWPWTGRAAARGPRCGCVSREPRAPPPAWAGSPCTPWTPPCTRHSTRSSPNWPGCAWWTPGRELGADEPDGPPSTRVLFSFRCGKQHWGTVAVDRHATAAALGALLDAVHYVLSDRPGRRHDAEALVAAPAG